MGRYTISDMMKTYGISKRTLHYYDTIDLLTAKRDERHHRYYEEEELCRLQCILMCRECGMSLDETADFLQKRSSLEALQHVLKNKRSLIQEELQLLSGKLEMLREFQKDGLHMDSKDVAHIQKKHMPMQVFMGKYTLVHILIVLFFIFDLIIITGLCYEAVQFLFL